jgi:hypothetical protein
MPVQFQPKKLVKTTPFGARKVGIALALQTDTMFGNVDCERYIDWSRSGRIPTAQRL